MNEVSWAKAVLFDGYKITQIDLLSKTPYSQIHKISTNKGDLFLKINNSLFGYEHKVIQTLQERFPKKSLKILFANDALNCFITFNAGIPLDEYFKAHPNHDAVESALMHYASIQQDISVDDLKKIKIRDLSLEILEERFFDALREGKPYFSKEKTEKIFRLREKINTAIHEIKKLGIRDALEHGDFHFGNMLFNNGEIVYIDWAEATITNPLFSLCSFKNSLVRRLGLQSDNDFAKDISKKYLTSFSEFYSIDYPSIEKAFALSNKVFSLYYIIALLGILALDEAQVKWQERINGSFDKIIADFD